MYLHTIITGFNEYSKKRCRVESVRREVARTKIEILGGKEKKN